MEHEYTLAELDIDYDNLGPDRFDVWVEIGREVPDSVLRTFRATVEFGEAHSGQIFQVGTLSGWCTTRGDYGGLADEGDAISGDAHVLASTAARINRRFGGQYLHVLMVDRATWAEEWRGHKIMGAVLTNIVDLLQFEAGSTMAITYPEPMALDGSGRLVDGPKRDAGLAKLNAACRAAGYEPWDEGDVWWRTFDIPEGTIF